MSVQQAWCCLMGRLAADQDGPCQMTHGVVTGIYFEDGSEVAVVAGDYTIDGSQTVVYPVTRVDPDGGC